MNCSKCDSDRVLMISAKCNDMCSMTFKGVEHDGYVPNDSPFGGGDYIEIDVCLDCGLAQGIEKHENPEFYDESVE